MPIPGVQRTKIGIYELSLAVLAVQPHRCIVGMNEASINLCDENLGSPEGQRFALEILRYLRSLIVDETGAAGLKRIGCPC